MNLDLMWKRVKVLNFWLDENFLFELFESDGLFIDLEDIIAQRSAVDWRKSYGINAVAADLKVLMVIVLDK